ncbi:hypothetical protein [Cohnella nanjingensis]|uniref:Uncharacterized protein n=1 Tax=Cohnella nanjingensis TaxID=1387779 RepID=A0A7X0VEH9_9BACL|nr:hypothetical protein [Cohnella nanjingensis]MBB6670298.1 hypothetical protein [Cohnella nanjingensis]
MHRIYVPSNFDIGDVAYFFEDTINTITSLNLTEVCFDFTRLTFIKPAGVVSLWNLVDLIGAKFPFIQLYYSIPDGYVQKPLLYPSVDYLDDSLFFEKVMGKRQHVASKPRSTTNGLEKLHHGKYNLMYIQNTISWLKGNVSLRKKSFGVLETALGEVFNNINNHSRSVIGGCAFAQHYPKNKEIHLCIADTGVGIPQKIRTKYSHDQLGNPLHRDCDAIMFATRAKVTTESTPGNRGMGFDNLLAIMGNNKGSMTIVSGKGKLTYDYNASTIISPDKIIIDDAAHSLPGTLIMLKFKTDTLDIEEEEDLEWS